MTDVKRSETRICRKVCRRSDDLLCFFQDQGFLSARRLEAIATRMEAIASTFIGKAFFRRIIFQLKLGSLALRCAKVLGYDVLGCWQQKSHECFF